ncbi:MAG: hypothetical protein V2J24_08040 [Pseudomonadales bacterium]|jgi:hypothetical protein|nr:hypothetical protein [Pseudomonadales bacterium]
MTDRQATALIVSLTSVVVVVLAVASMSTAAEVLCLVQKCGRTANFSLVPAIAISAGVLIAILTFARDRTKIAEERTRATSEIMLQRASAAFDTTIQLLRDKNNNRVIWVRAARLLRRAVELGDLIHDSDYAQAYQLESERARHELYDALSIEDPETGGRKALPPQFFYGIDDWDSEKSLDQAAKKASAEVEAYGVSIDENPPEPKLGQLAPRSVVAIYDFLEYPNDYDDPLDRVAVWDGNYESARGIDAGAKRYVAHDLEHFAIGGKLHKRTKANDGDG